MRYTLFVPTRNEIDGVKAIMPRIRREWVDEIIVVDGNSTDGTAEWLRGEGYQVIPQRSRGLIGAYWECFEVATGDVIIPFTPDGNSIPELIPPLIAKMEEGYDLVIVSRYLGDAKSEDDDWLTAFGNHMFTAITNLLFRGRYTDVLVAYKAFKKSLIESLSLDARIPGFDLQMEIRCLKKGLKVGEIPGDEPLRIGGVRKMQPLRDGSFALYIILRELFVYWPEKVKPRQECRRGLELP